MSWTPWGCPPGAPLWKLLSHLTTSLGTGVGYRQPHKRDTTPSPAGDESIDSPRGVVQSLAAFLLPPFLTLSHSSCAAKVGLTGEIGPDLAADDEHKHTVLVQWLVEEWACGLNWSNHNEIKHSFVHPLEEKETFSAQWKLKLLESFCYGGPGAGEQDMKQLTENRKTSRQNHREIELEPWSN